jgi:hypothetical protein
MCATTTAASLGGIAPDDSLPGRAHRGQISGTPEDGESLFGVVK